MSEAVKISGVIITFNEEQNIARCLDSLVDVCDEIIVVDSFSTDRTKEICTVRNVRFIENTFGGHVSQKNFALAQAIFPVALSLDADEALSDELKNSILEVKNNFTADAYSFNRFTNYCGQWIKHSGWYPDVKVRLLRTDKGNWGGTDPHDCIILTPHATHKKISGDLLHYSYSTMEEHILRSVKYAKISAKAMQKQGRKTSYFKIVLSATFRFVQDYFFRRGYRDGFYGFVISAANGVTAFLKYTYLKQLNRGKKID